MTLADWQTIVLTIQGLWPEHRMTEERNSRYFSWFKNYTIEEVQESLRAYYDENTDRYPNLKKVRAALFAKCRRVDVQDWTWSDEQELFHIKRSMRELDQPIPPDEELIADRLDKRPLPSDRERAQRMWRQIVDQEYERQAQARGMTASRYREHLANLEASYGRAFVGREEGT